MERRDTSASTAPSKPRSFRLVIDHTAIRLLHNISEFVVRSTKLSPLGACHPRLHQHSHFTGPKMFVPTESGDSFQKKYFEAIQRDPVVVIDHAELVRLFNNEPPDFRKS